MSMFYKFVQGNDQKIRVYSLSSFIIIKNDSSIQTFNNVITDDQGNYWLDFCIDMEHFIEAGIAQYQIFQNNQLKQWGACQIIPNLALDPNQESRSKYRIIVDAIEAKIAGTATKAQRTVKVADKEIQYMSGSELMAYLDYFKKKMAEEQGQVDTATNELKIKRIWRLR